jgi:hypothetical protein
VPKLGIMVKDLGPSQLNYNIISQANAIVGSRSDTDVIVFYDVIQRPCMTVNFAVMQMVEAYSFDGPVVATTFKGAAKLLSFPGPSKKAFFVNDLEWTRPWAVGATPSFRELRSVYAAPALLLISRGPDHKKLIEDAWDVPVHAIDDFDLKQILELMTS